MMLGYYKEGAEGQRIGSKTGWLYLFATVLFLNGRLYFRNNLYIIHFLYFSPHSSRMIAQIF